MSATFTSPSAIHRRWLPVLVILLAVAAGAVWSWGRWLDPIIDFGREIYVPWRLVEGDALYREIDYLNGPFSPTFNCIWLRIFGRSLRALFVLNLLILTVAALLIHDLQAKATDGFTALIGALTFVGVFAYGQYEYIANSNWMAPYSHDLPHGIVLTLLGLALLYRAVARDNSRLYLLSGACLGLVFLTKAEVFLASLIGFGCGMGVIWMRHKRTERRRVFSISAWWLGGVLCPILLALIWLLWQLPAPDAFRGLAGTWPHVLGGSFSSIPAYPYFMGIDNIPGNSWRIVKWLVGYGACGGLVWAICRYLPKRVLEPFPVRAAAMLVGAVLTVVLVRGTPLFLLDYARPWQILLLATLTGVALGVWRQRHDQSPPEVQVLRVAGIVFSLVLLAKMILFVRVWQYGFALAMPAAQIIVALVFWWLPRRLPLAFQRTFCRALAGGIWIGLVAAHVMTTHHFYQEKRHVVGTGGDAFLADSRGAMFEEARRYLSDRIQPGDKLLVVPEGILLNYLLQTPADMPVVALIPWIYQLYREEALLARIADVQPEWLVIVHRDMSEEGARFFGRDYARETAGHLARHYEYIHRIGAMPLSSESFGILIGRRRADIPPESGVTEPPAETTFNPHSPSEN